MLNKSITGTVLRGCFVAQRWPRSQKPPGPLGLGWSMCTSVIYCVNSRQLTSPWTRGGPVTPLALMTTPPTGGKAVRGTSDTEFRLIPSRHLGMLPGTRNLTLPANSAGSTPGFQGLCCGGPGGEATIGLCPLLHFLRLFRAVLGKQLLRA